MVAYSFKKAFAGPIIDLTKRQTIRGVRRRHARVGETLQLFTGMRTKHCRLIGTAECLDVNDVCLNFREGLIYIGKGPIISVSRGLDQFAISDGFASWDELVKFWRITHPGDEVFFGVLIYWGTTFVASAA